MIMRGTHKMQLQLQLQPELPVVCLCVALRIRNFYCVYVMHFDFRQHARQAMGSVRLGQDERGSVGQRGCIMVGGGVRQGSGDNLNRWRSFTCTPCKMQCARVCRCLCVCVPVVVCAGVCMNKCVVYFTARGPLFPLYALPLIKIV